MRLLCGPLLNDGWRDALLTRRERIQYYVLPPPLSDPIGNLPCRRRREARIGEGRGEGRGANCGTVHVDLDNDDDNNEEEKLLFLRVHFCFLVGLST